MSIGSILVLVTASEARSPGWFVKPKHAVDCALFQHCNKGRSYASTQDFLAEVWPTIQLHPKYTAYRIVEADEQPSQKGEEKCQR